MAGEDARPTPPPSQTAPDFKGAIGVTPDSVEGVDIAVPVYHFSETHYLPDAIVTPAYRGTLFNLTGKVNLCGTGLWPVSTGNDRQDAGPTVQGLRCR